MNKYIILGHENPDFDSLVSGYILEKIMKAKNYDVEFIIPDKKLDELDIKLCKKYGFNPENKMKTLPSNKEYKYILVDHHERITPGEIEVIIDHHPTDKIINTKFYKNTKSSSTACLLVKDNEKLLTNNDLILVILSALIDTAAFHSNKTNELDVLWAKNTCKKLNISYEELVKESMYETDITDIYKSSLNGLKKHNLNNYQVHSSYIHIYEIKRLNEVLNDITNYLKEYIKKEHIDYFIFIVHDIKYFKTTTYLISKDNITATNYDSYTSRGTTIIPKLNEYLKQKKI